MRVSLQARSKAKAKPQRRDSASSSTKTFPIGERIWTDVEPGEYSISDYAVSKNLIHRLRHGNLPREDDGAIDKRDVQDVDVPVLFSASFPKESRKYFEGTTTGLVMNLVTVCHI